MSNSTAAGPSRGLLDVLFGTAAPEEAEADGQGFAGLMNLIKSMNGKKEAEGTGADTSRTLRETLAGLGAADAGATSMSAMGDSASSFAGDQLGVASTMGELESRERTKRFAELGLPAAMMFQAPVASPVSEPEALNPEMVNQVLRQKGLPPLGPQEMKLLQDVNGKLAQAQAGQGKAEIPPELPAGVSAEVAVNDPRIPQLPNAATPNGPAPIDPQLQKAVAAKGVDPRKLKAAETTPPPVSGTPEKLLTTETYLQMHESMNAKGPLKDAGVKAPEAPVADASAAAKPAAALTAGAVAGVAAKEPGIGSRKRDDNVPLPEGAKQAKLDALAAGGFTGALAQRSEATKHDVYLPGADKPEQRANVLLAEVGSGVSFHANKGGGEMRLVIHPDDMGEVKLKVGTKNGKVEVQLTAENEDVAKMLRGGSKDLEASLKDQNLSLAKFEVSVSDASSVVSTDTKSNLSEQFLSQNQQQPQHGGSGFAQGSLNDDGRSARWGASDQGGSQGGNRSARAEDSGRTAARNAAVNPQRMTARASTGSGRLDIVA